MKPAHDVTPQPLDPEIRSPSRRDPGPTGSEAHPQAVLLRHGLLAMAVTTALLAGTRAVAAGPLHPITGVLALATSGFLIAFAGSRQTPRFSGHAIPLVGLLAIAAMGFGEGGLASEAMFWLPVAPLAAACVLGARAALVYGVLAAAVPTGIGHVETTTPLAIPASTLDALPALRALSLTGAVATAAVLSSLFRSSQEEVKEALQAIAMRHPLTGLGNRRAFQDHITQVMARCQRHGNQVGLLFIDLDRFKQVNDVYGHAIGDALLVQVAQRLEDTLRREEAPFHLGGDEFVAVVEGRDLPFSAPVVRFRLKKALERPYELVRRGLLVKVSIGMVVGGADDDWEGLLSRADDAMYRAKRRSAPSRPLAPAHSPSPT